MKTSKNNLLKQATGGFVTKIFAALLGFGLSVIFARMLGPEGFGIYSVALSISNLLAMALTLGLPVLVVRQVAIYKSNKQWSLLQGLLLISYQWPLKAMIAIGILALPLYYILPGNYSNTMFFILALSILIAVNQIRAAAMRGLNWVVLADVPELILKPVVMIAMIAISALIGLSANNASWAMSIQVSATLCTFALGAWILKRRLPIEISTVTVEYDNKKWLFAGISFFAVAIISAIEGQISLLMLGGIAGAKEAGIFQAAFQLVSPLIFGLLAVNMALQTKLAAAWEGKNIEYSQQIVSEAARLGFVVALIVAIPLIVFADEFLSLFGNSYIEATMALKIIVFGQLVNAAAGSCGVLLSMTGNQREVLLGMVLALIINSSLCFLLIPTWGVDGAAVGTAVGLVTWNVYMASKAKRITGIKTYLTFK